MIRQTGSPPVRPRPCNQKSPFLLGIGQKLGLDTGEYKLRPLPARAEIRSFGDSLLDPLAQLVLGKGQCDDPQGESSRLPPDLAYENQLDTSIGWATAELAIALRLSQTLGLTRLIYARIAE